MALRLFRFRKPHRSPPGSPPGTLTVDPGAQAPRMHAMLIGPDGVDETDTPDIAPPPDGRVLWLNVAGLGDLATLQQIARVFNLHPLAMEDVVSLNQRPKAEDYENHQFLVLRMPDMTAGDLTTDQVSVFLVGQTVITFEERSGDVFDPVRARLRNPQSPIRARGADYLTYALIDAAIDSFFPVVDKMGERLESLEDEIIDETGLVQIGMIHALKHQLMGLRSTIWPMRDMLSTILREEHPRFGEATRIYLRDAQDHTFQLIDMIETYREIATGLVDIFLSAQSNRMNEVMQVLTLIATIFIPLTFIVGVYGMNFVDMPELHWRWGYPAVLLLMALIALVLTLWFRRKGWLGGGGRR